MKSLSYDEITANIEKSIVVSLERSTAAGCGKLHAYGVFYAWCCLTASFQKQEDFDRLHKLIFAADNPSEKAN